MKYASSIEFNEKNVKAVQRGSTELDTTVGMLLKANFGPAQTLTKITSESDLVEKFGYPTDYNYIDWFNAAGFLKYSAPLYVIRPLDDATTETNAFIVFDDDGSTEPADGAITNMYNEEVAFETLDDTTATNVTEGNIHFYNKWVGNLDDVAIMLCTNETQWTESISKRDIFDETIALESTIYTRSTLPTLDGTNFKNKDKIVVMKPVVDGTPEMTGINYYMYYANYTTATVGTWVATTAQLTDLDRVFVTSKNLAYTFDHTFTSCPTIDNYVYDGTIYDELDLPDESDWETDDRIIVRQESDGDVFEIWTNVLGATWTDTTDVLTTADVLLYTSDLNTYDITITVDGGDDIYSAIITDPTVVYDLTPFTQDTTITTSDEILIKKDANGVITNSVVKYLDNNLYNKTNYNPLTYEYILPKKPDFAHNEIGVVVLRRNRVGWFYVAETFVNSLTSTAIQTNGKSNYIEPTVNNNSKLIYVKCNNCVNTTTFVSDDYNSVYTCTLTDTVESDRSNIRDYTTLYNVASGVFGKNGYFQPEILLGYDCGDSTLGSGYLDAMSLIAEETGMSLAVVGMTRATPGQTESETNDEVINDLGNRRDNTSYGGLTEFNTYTYSIGTMKKFYDQYNDKYRWLSVVGDVAGMMVRNDAMFGPQSPSAGYNRGKFSNYAKMLYDGKINQDELSKNGINAIVKDIENGEFYLFEYITNTTLDEITKEANIRRMIIKIKHLLNDILKGNYFEFNNKHRRDITIYKIKGIFEKYKANGGLYDYKLICDETNNTAERINANEFILDIRLQPNRLIKHIIINITNYDMGLSLTELSV